MTVSSEIALLIMVLVMAISGAVLILLTMNGTEKRKAY